MCPFSSEEAKRLWNKACNRCRGRDPHHQCGNPAACKQRFEEAEREEEKRKAFERRWS